jgi:DNA phosphorothioation-dependent restriction protein DptH
MSQGLRPLEPEDLLVEAERELLPALAQRLRAADPGHCVRVTDLDRDLMVRLCGRLRAEVPEAQVVILGNGHPNTPAALTVTSTRLVELRNPLADGSLRPPLLVFVPSELHAAAEDSFSEATFEVFDPGDLYAAIGLRLLRELPDPVRGSVMACIERTRAPDRWPFADWLAVVRYLLTARANGNDAEALGAALYELALVPDFELLAEPARALTRISRNRRCVEALTWSPASERGRVLALGLRRGKLQADLAELLVETGAEDPRRWTQRIVMDRTCWPLAFHRWEFADDQPEATQVFIGDVAVDLPEVGEDPADPRLRELAADEQILVVGKGGTRKFNVSFRTAPHPGKVPGLARFVAQVVARDRGPVGLVRSKAVWSTPRLDATVGFSGLAKVSWEDGWHFVRVLAESESGELIPLVDADGRPVPWSADAEGDQAPRTHESDLFYVVRDLTDPPPPTQRAVPRDDSLEHARIRMQFTAVLGGRTPAGVLPTSVRWSDKGGRRGPAGAEVIEVQFGREGTAAIHVSRTLKLLEQGILAQPDGPMAWHLPIRMGVPDKATPALAAWPVGPEASAFLGARRAWFETVRQGDRELVTQALDAPAARASAVAYVRAWQALLASLLGRAVSGDDPAAVRDLTRLLALDTVVLSVTDHRGERREAGLVAPTHPLRVLWFTTWAAMGAEWAAGASAGPPEALVPAREALLRHLAPLGFPPVLTPPAVAELRSRMMTPVDSIHPLWTLYAPSREDDPRGLLGEVCAALGLPEPGVGAAVIDGEALAGRVERYLLQHPYVRTLLINAFNPGRGGVLADMLLALQRRDAFSGIRYDLRLFVPDPDAPGVGDALTELLSPSATLTGRDVDAFHATTGEPLRPKLALAVRATSEFSDQHERFPAHLSFLFDLFPPEEVGATSDTDDDHAAPVHGLVQDFRVVYKEDQASVTWQRTPRHGVARPLADGDELTRLLSEAPALVSAATATVATGNASADLRPVITLSLGSHDRALLHRVHEVSDWVVLLDRNMGIEFFDHNGLPKRSGDSHDRERPLRPDYLIDHTPDVAGALGHRLTITSRSVAELEALLAPVLASYGLSADGGRALVLLTQLRSLSGRLALKLISAPNQRAEALGLALARIYLEHQGVFLNQIVLPLDAHLDLYRSAQAHAHEIGDDVSLKRTDLALFDLNAAARRITVRLVEVKCYSAVGDVGAWGQLQKGIAAQIDQSAAVLSGHFGGSPGPRDRVDRLMKTRELVALLEFYLDRSVRYGIIDEAAATEARYFLRTLEDGYTLAFTRSALVFDFQKNGRDIDVEHGIEFHRVGTDLIRELVDSAVPPDVSTSTGSLGGVGQVPPESSRAVLDERRSRAPSVATLARAAFLAEDRDRSVSAESLRVPMAPPPAPAPEPAPAPALEPTPAPAGERVAVIAPPERRPEALAPDLEPALARVDAPNLPSAAGQSAPIGKEPAPPESADAVVELGSAEGELAEQPDVPVGPGWDVMLGVSGASPQYGLLGDVAMRMVALDLNHTHTISLFGVQGGGKSYTLGSIAEMASLPIPGINRLPQPLATVIFHYSPTMDYAPEFTSMVAPNSDAAQVQVLRERYGAEPKALADVVILVPSDKLDERRSEFPGVDVRPLRFAAAELQASHWRFLIGAVGNQATYIRQLNLIMKKLRNDMTLESLREGIDGSSMADHLKQLAHGRLELAAEFIDDETRLGDVLRPGRLLIVDLRDEYIEKDQALGLFVVLLQLFSEVTYEGRKFNKLVVFDEAHKYIESPDLVAGLVEVVREMRHKGTSILVASQDPPSVPVPLIELSSQIILHKFNSPAWLKHIQKANAALATLTADKMANLKPGEAYVWSSKASDDAFCQGAVKVRCRPRVTQHGGATKTAVK